MDYYSSEDFIKESLKAAVTPSNIETNTIDEHTPLVDLFEYWTDDTALVKIQLIDWSLHQRFFIHPNHLNELIHYSITELVNLFKSQNRMNPKQFIEMYQIYGKMKITLHEEFCDQMLSNLNSIKREKYLNQRN